MPPTRLFLTGWLLCLSSTPAKLHPLPHIIHLYQIPGAILDPALLAPLSFHTHTQAIRVSLLAQGSLTPSTPLPALSPAQSELPVWDSPNTLRTHLSASGFCPSAVGHRLSSRDDSFQREIIPCLFCSRQLWSPSLLPSGFQRSPLALPSNSQTSSPTNPSLQHPSPVGLSLYLLSDTLGLRFSVPPTWTSL